MQILLFTPQYSILCIITISHILTFVRFPDFLWLESGISAQYIVPVDVL